MAVAQSKRCVGNGELAGEEGFEPSHGGIKIRCLNQLGYSPTVKTFLEGGIASFFDPVGRSERMTL
jgi:hypothetical protein